MGRVHAGELSAVTSSVRALQADIEAIDSRLTKRFDSADAKMLEIQAATEVLQDQEVTAATAACNVMGALEVQAAHCAALAAETDRVQGMLRQLEHQESALLHQACWRDAPGRYRAVTRQPPRLACPSLHPRLRTTCECKCRCPSSLRISLSTECVRSLRQVVMCVVPRWWHRPRCKISSTST